MDIIVSEPNGYMLFNERKFETYLHASLSPFFEASTMAEYTKKLVQCSQYAGKLKFCWDVLFNRLAFLLRVAEPRNAKVPSTPLDSQFRTARHPQRCGFTCLRTRLSSPLNPAVENTTCTLGTDSNESSDQAHKTYWYWLRVWFLLLPPPVENLSCVRFLAFAEKKGEP